MMEAIRDRRVIEPGVGSELHAGALAATSRRAIEAGVTTEAEVQEMLSSLRAKPGAP